MNQQQQTSVYRFYELVLLLLVHVLQLADIVKGSLSETSVLPFYVGVRLFGREGGGGEGGRV